METGNASISEECPLECAEHQSCVLSPEVPPSPKAKSKYMHSVNAKAVLNFSLILTFIQTWKKKKESYWYQVWVFSTMNHLSWLHTL